jgi:hypothetical protein
MDSGSFFNGAPICKIAASDLVEDVTEGFARTGSWIQIVNFGQSRPGRKGGGDATFPPSILQRLL